MASLAQRPALLSAAHFLCARLVWEGRGQEGGAAGRCGAGRERSPSPSPPGGSHAPDTHRGQTQHCTPGCTHGPCSPGGRGMGSPGPLLPLTPSGGSAGGPREAGVQQEASRGAQAASLAGKQNRGPGAPGSLPQSRSQSAVVGGAGKTLANWSLRQKQLQTAALRLTPWRPLAVDAADCRRRDLRVWPRCRQP